MMEQELLMVTVKDLSLREGGVLGHLPVCNSNNTTSNNYCYLLSNHVSQERPNYAAGINSSTMYRLFSSSLTQGSTEKWNQYDIQKYTRGDLVVHVITEAEKSH